MHQQNGDRDKKLAELRRQRDNVLYELQLRQDELDRMLANAADAKRHGAIGVSDDWLARKGQLQEEIIQLKVRVHDLESQITPENAPPKP